MCLLSVTYLVHSLTQLLLYFWCNLLIQFIQFDYKNNLVTLKPIIEDENFGVMKLNQKLQKVVETLKRLEDRGHKVK